MGQKFGEAGGGAVWSTPQRIIFLLPLYPQTIVLRIVIVLLLSRFGSGCEFVSPPRGLLSPERLQTAG